ncbi:MAG: nitrilase family protein [Muribaculaceae bacterium]|nr:nitrilase family protein [Muribaculaceae bacterium]
MSLDSSLRILALSLDIVWADPEANLRLLAKAMEAMPPHIDIVVLPELFSTGFVNDTGLLTDLPETNGGPTLTAVRELARRYNCAIAGSFLARTAHNIFNRAFFIEPSGDETYYDKRHLFSLSSESKTYARGGAFKPVIRFRGWNIAMIVCYDLRFPAWCRNRDNEYELLLVPANWPSAREYAWKHLLIARAIENQAYVVGANRGGRDDYGEYADMTEIFDPMGKPCSEKAVSLDGAVVATLHKSAIDEWRRRFPVAADADFFDIPLEI